MRIRPVGADFFHADGQTGITKLTFAFRNLANVPKNVALLEKMKNMQILTKKFSLCSSDRRPFCIGLRNAQPVDLGMLFTWLARAERVGLSC